MFNASSYDHEATTTTATEGEWKKGEKQPSACKDSFFAVLFLLHIVAMAIVVGLFGTEALNDVIAGISSGGNANAADEAAADEAAANNFSGYMYAAGIIGALTFAFSSLMLIFMIKFANILIKISLLFSVALSLITALLALVARNLVGAIVGFLFFAISICYASMVWSRIPFATANLRTALTAVKSNFGIILVAYLFVILAFAWSLFWTLAFIGVYDKTNVCDPETNVCNMNYGYLFLLFLSAFWTQQVIMNTLHVTVAGLIGTWWFAPNEASSCCSTGVTSSLFRATTYSFGSICFGSLLVAIIQSLRQLANTARGQDDGNEILICIADCILGCLESILEYFNKWAYVYVGLYGYGYIDAGKNVIQLFKARGWEVVIADDLVANVLFLVSLITGLIMGAAGLLINKNTSWFITAGESAQVYAFVLGFIIGLILCSIMLGVVASGVNTTIVLYAEAPSEFQENHHDLSNKMRAAWLEAYPGIIS